MRRIPILAELAAPYHVGALREQPDAAGKGAGSIGEGAAAEAARV